MVLTLLEIVQMILSSLNMDQVNSISDTPESIQVATVIKQTYMNMLGRYDMPEHNQPFQLTSPDLSGVPTLMLRPPGVTRIEWVKYFDTNPSDANQLQSGQFGAYSHGVNTDLQNNSIGWSTTSSTSNTIGTGAVTFTVPAGLLINTNDAATAYNGNASMTGTVGSYSGTTLILNITSITGSGTYSSWAIFNGSSLPVGPGYQDVRMIPFEDFISMTGTFNVQESNIGTYQLSIPNNDTGQVANFTIFYRSDITPQYCAIAGNEYILFDAYDNTQDTALQPSKFMAYGWVYPPFTMSDTFVINLQDQQVPLLIADAKALAFYELKQMPHQRAEKEVDRQIVSLQKWKAIANKPSYFDELPNFGRSGGYLSRW